MTNEQAHATCVAIDDLGVFIRGVSGSGKSDLALRLIDRGATLVADDRVDLAVKDEAIFAAPPISLAGKLEVRGVGIISMSYQEPIPLGLIVDLVAPETVERLPETTKTTLLGLAIPVVRLPPFEASTVTKVELALKIAQGDIEFIE